MNLLESKICWKRVDCLQGRLELAAGERAFLMVDKLENAEIVLAEDSRLELFLFLREGAVLSKKLIVKLSGARAAIKVTVIVIGSAQQNFFIESICDHQAQATVSDFVVRAVMFDQSHLDFTGKIVIPAEGQHSDASLKCQTLLMSKEAQARTIPSLEIIANDVKAGHAAATGRVDDELMFYLECRGFDRELAQKLLVEGFLQEAVMRMGDENLRAEIWGKVLSKLNYGNE